MNLCLVKVLHYEAQEYNKKKHILECSECPIKDKCKEKAEQALKEGVKNE